MRYLSNRSLSPSEIDHPAIPVFQQIWWLRLARGNGPLYQIDVKKSNVIVGVLRYFVRRNKVGLRWAGAPHWSHLGGPILSPSLDADEKRYVLRQLLSQLPGHLSLNFESGTHLPDADLIRHAFIEAGFEHTRQNNYTQRPDQLGIFLADAVDDLGLQRAAQQSSNIRSSNTGATETTATPLSQGERRRIKNLNKTRSHIRQANNDLEQIEIDADQFEHFYDENLRESGKKPYSPLSVGLALTKEGMCRGQVKLFAVRKRAQPYAGEEPPLDAAIACAMDKERLYLWRMTTRRHKPGNPYDKPNRDAMKVVIVKAMKYARQEGLIFDADGVAVGDTESLYKSRLRIPNLEYRDAFRRPAMSAKLLGRVLDLVGRPRATNPSPTG
jgi:hypothetical protein